MYGYLFFLSDMCFPIAIPCLIQTRDSLAERLKTLYTAEFVVYAAMQGSESLRCQGGKKRNVPPVKWLIFI